MEFRRLCNGRMAMPRLCGQGDDAQTRQWSAKKIPAEMLSRISHKLPAISAASGQIAGNTTLGLHSATVPAGDQYQDRIRYLVECDEWTVRARRHRQRKWRHD